MIHKCSSEELFNAPCQYEGEVDTDKHAFSIRHINGESYYYHYLDYVRSSKETILLSSTNKRKLSKHLIGIWESGRQESWIAMILAACGYNVKGDNAKS